MVKSPIMRETYRMLSTLSSTLHGEVLSRVAVIYQLCMDAYIYSIVAINNYIKG